ncbi:MAG: transposase [Methanobrevibacter sp.]|nr:transposase [Methanobrevibacter sp.]
MVKRKFDKNQAKLGIKTIDWNVPKDHISRFVVEFIDEVFPLLEIKEPKKKKGRDSLPIDSMLKLLVYAKIQHIDRTSIIADMARYHDIFKYVCDDIRPSERSIQRYRREYGCYFEVLLQMTLKKAFDEGFTDFNHVAIDGTIKKAYNSNNNTITKKETQILVDYYEGRPVAPESLEKLHKPAKRLLEKKGMDDEDKLELLYGIETQFTFTGQERIPVNDIEVRFMKGKKGNSLVAYNIQSAVDYDTKLICAINVTQNPTDHYELPNIAEKAIRNIQIKPKYISADTIYLNEISLSYLADEKIDGLIPNRKQSKEKIGRLNKNPYHKDHFVYDYELDAFKCPENQYMYYFKTYTEPHKDPEKPDKIKRLYNNYEACKHCSARNKCCSSSQTHRTITEYGSEMQKAMNQKMEKQEYKDEYAKRSSVEGPFGIFKEQFQIEKEVVVGMIRTEERINLDALAYNLIRLHNIKQQIENTTEDLEDFCESTSIKNQLKLEVTIF